MAIYLQFKQLRTQQECNTIYLKWKRLQSGTVCLRKWVSLLGFFMLHKALCHHTRVEFDAEQFLLERESKAHRPSKRSLGVLQPIQLSSCRMQAPASSTS